jgi:hypothetical protein
VTLMDKTHRNTFRIEKENTQIAKKSPPRRGLACRFFAGRPGSSSR